MSKKSRVRFEPDTRYVFVDGIKICQYDPQNGLLLFFDKNKHRSEARGTSLIGIPLQAFCCGVDQDRCATVPAPIP